MGGGRRVGFNIPLADTQVAVHAPAAEFPVEEMLIAIRMRNSRRANLDDQL